MDIDCIGAVLSNGHFSTFSQHVPLYTDMFHLHDSGVENSRAGQRIDVGIAEIFQVSSMGQQWF
jgi:hypothetical protein